MFIVESEGHIPMPQPLFSERVSEELGQTEGMSGEVLDLRRKLKISQFPILMSYICSFFGLFVVIVTDDL